MKKIYSTFLSLVLISGFFSCENKKEESTTTTTETSATDSIAMSGTEAPSEGQEIIYNADTAESHIKWVGKKVTGQHNGQIKIKDGQVKTVNNTVTGGMLTLDMTSITDEDLTEKDKNKKLVDHLKSEDFFSVEKYPTGTFEVTRVDAGKSDNEQILTGKLMLKGKSEEISVPVKVSQNDNKITVKGATVIDRSKWDVRYGSTKFFPNIGDKVIYDEVELEFELVANK